MQEVEMLRGERNERMKWKLLESMNLKAENYLYGIHIIIIIVSETNIYNSTKIYITYIN